MDRVHLTLGYLLIALNLLVGVWGLALRNVATNATSAGRWFIQLRATAFTTMAAAGIAGLMLLGDGRRPSDPLHSSVYGPFMVLGLVVAWGFRADSTPLQFQRVLAVTSLIITGLGIRALTTG